MTTVRDECASSPVVRPEADVRPPSEPHAREPQGSRANTFNVAMSQHDHGNSSEATAAAPLEAQFVVRESGRIGFVAQFLAHRSPETPSLPPHVSALSFTLAPRNRSLVRRIAVVDGRMPDGRMTASPRAYIERIGSAEELIADLGCAVRSRGDLRLSSAIELARGTYAIAAHRDHVHLLYELEPRIARACSEDDLGLLLAHLRIAPRGSLLTAVCALGAPASRLVGRFEPASLDHEGVELVFAGPASSFVSMGPAGRA